MFPARGQTREVVTLEDTSVKLAVTVIKNPGRKSGYQATYGEYPYDIWADGSTAAEAKARLTAKLATALQTITAAKPTFARADDGALWAAVPAFDGGCCEWRITEDARGSTSSSRPASEAFATCVGMTVIPNR